MEVWKDIIGYNGDYKIGTSGNVKSFRRNKNGKLLKKYCYNNREYVRISTSGKPYTYYIDNLMRKYFPTTPYKNYKSQFK